MLASKTIRKLQLALNRRDAEGALKLYAESVKVSDPFDEEGRASNRTKLENEISVLTRSFPDLSVTFSNLRRVCGKECVVAEVQITGTHKPFLFATNKHIDLRGAVFWRLNRDGLIVEERRYYDVAGGFRQLGWKLPERLGGPAEKK